MTVWWSKAWGIPRKDNTTQAHNLNKSLVLHFQVILSANHIHFYFIILTDIRTTARTATHCTTVCAPILITSATLGRLDIMHWSEWLPGDIYLRTFRTLISHSLFVCSTAITTIYFLILCFQICPPSVDLCGISIMQLDRLMWFVITLLMTPLLCVWWCINSNPIV
jgi:hypothetical protein